MNALIQEKQKNENNSHLININKNFLSKTKQSFHTDVNCFKIVGYQKPNIKKKMNNNINNSNNSNNNQ